MGWIERGPYFKIDRWMIICRCGWDMWSETFNSVITAASRHVYFAHGSDWVPLPYLELEKDRETYNFLTEVGRYMA